VKNTKLYIKLNDSYKQLDITDVDILLQFEEVNIRSFENLKAEHSKTIVLPGTPNNNDVLSFLYDITSSGSFKILKKTPCYIEAGSNILFEGSFKLINVTINPNGVKEYEAVLTAKTIDFFDDLKKLKLKDIDLSDFDHVLNKTNVQNSWDTSIRYQGQTIPFELGFGYVYPLEFRGVNDIGYLWSPKDMSPAVYIKTLIDKGLAQLGYNYISEFFNSERFKRLIMPNVYQRVPLSEDEIKCRQFDGIATSASLVELNSIQGINQTINFIQLNASDSERTTRGTLNDPCNLNQGDYFQIGANGDYKIDIKHNITIYVDETDTLSYTSWSIKNQANQQAKIKYRISIVDYATNIVLTSNEKIISIPTTPQTSSGFSFTDEISINYSSYFGNGHQIAVIATIISDDIIYCRRQDNVQMKFRIQASADEDIKLTLATPYCEEGDTIGLNRCFNNETTLYDIFKDIGKLFNLRYNFKNEGKTIEIEPAATYYNKGVVKDWSKKIDDSKPIIIQTISDLDYNKIKFHYIEDGDYHNKATIENYNVYYGEQTVDIDNDWSEGERVIKTETIASTPNVNYLGDICVPYYVTYDGGNYKPMAQIKPRLLIYGGLVQSETAWCWISKTVEYNASNIIANLRYTYPFAGHVNKPYNQTWDINFGIARAYYWNYNTITDDNLYSTYYKQIVESEINPETKILIAYFNLSDEDIYNFKYNDKIFIDNTYYRVNKIIDYNPLKSEVTKVEIVKVVEADLYVPKRRVLRRSESWTNSEAISLGNLGEFTEGSGSVPVGDMGVFKGGVKSNLAQVKNGHNNFINENAANVLINGSGNIVQSASQNVSITGSNNKVLNGAGNVVIIGSGVTITESNTTYIDGIGIIKNGVLVPQEFNVVDGGVDEVQNPFSVTTMNVIDAGSNTVQNVNYDFNINIIEE
jgi:hypothetical protein